MSKMIETIYGLAGVLGCDESRLRRARRRGTWPGGVPVSGPWGRRHVAALREWIADRDAERCADPDLAEERRELVKSRRRKLDLETRIMRGEMVRRDEVEHHLVRAVVRCRSGLLSLPRHVCAELVNKLDVAEIEAILLRRLEAIAGDYERDLRDGEGAVESPVVDDGD